MKSLTHKSIWKGAAALGLLALGSPSIYAAGAPAEAPQVEQQKGGKDAEALPQQDSEFLKNAAKANAEEVALGILAIQKSNNNEIKDFGRELVETHIQGFKDLLELSVQKRQMIPFMELQLPIAEIAQLGISSGPDFDKAFIVAVIGKQMRNQAGLIKYNEQTKDGEMREYASQLLENIKERISDAQQIGTGLGVAAEQLNPPPVAESPKEGK